MINKKGTSMAFTELDLQRLCRLTLYFEGEELQAYHDSKGILTVGVGHNCIASPIPEVTKYADPITKERSRQLLKADMRIAIEQVQKALPWVMDMVPARQAVLYDMCFNMGLGNDKRGLLSFNKPGGTLSAIRAGDYSYAALRFERSQWARDVGSRRTDPLLAQLRTGVWWDYVVCDS